MKSKIHAHAMRNRLFYMIAPVVLILVSLAASANYHGVYEGQRTFYTSNLEHQSLSELDLYHEGSAQLVRQYFRSALTTVNSLAKDNSTQQAILKHQTDSLTTTLTQQLATSGQFSSLSLLDDKGALAALRATNGVAVPAGTDELKSAAWLAAKDAHSTVLIALHRSSLNRNVLSIAAPIRDTKGTFIGVATGAMTLPTLADHIKLSSTYDKNFDALLTDSDGNSLIWKNRPTADIVNVSETEPLLSRLRSQSDLPTSQEFNFEGQDSFARASTLDFGASGKLYLVSYYSLAGFKAKQTAASQSINKMLAGFIIRDCIFTLIALGLVAGIGRYHETHKS